MKRNKFRSNNNYNNQGYSLSYKFDSVSPAGKCSGTALELIKRYNDLAKEAHGNGNYVEAEVFRQYAEHYRKIVTEINERKQRFEVRDAVAPEAKVEVANSELPQPVENIAEVSAAPEVAETQQSSLVETKAKKSFHVIEITEDAPKPCRAYKPRAKKTADAVENA